MIGEKVAAALNLQMNREFYGARLYLPMAAYFHAINMEEAARWMELQSHEETEHAMRLYEHLQDRGARIVIAAIKAPPKEWDSPLAALEAAYKHECTVTREFDEHLELARAEQDNATINFLQWFANEQVEEEASADNIVQKMKMTKGATFMIDRMLAQRGQS